MNRTSTVKATHPAKDFPSITQVGLKALNLAENATHNLHNVYPIRGAQVRDALAWAKYLNDARAGLD